MDFKTFKIMQRYIPFEIIASAHKKVDWPHKNKKVKAKVLNLNKNSKNKQNFFNYF